MCFMLPSENITQKVPKHREDFKLDKGFFVIDVDHIKKDIQVQYYESSKNNADIRSGKLRMIFRGQNGIDLYRAILLHDFIDHMDHAAYLGYELARAENSLKTNRKFIQDKDTS